MNYAITLYNNDEVEKAREHFALFELLFQVLCRRVYRMPLSSPPKLTFPPHIPSHSPSHPLVLQELDEETKNSDPEVIEQQQALAAVIKQK